MTEVERNTIIETIVQLVERRIRDRAWLDCPSGPLVREVFDRARCYAEVRQIMDVIQDSLPPPEAMKKEEHGG